MKNTTIKTNLIKVSYDKRKDEKTQLKVLLKVGYQVEKTTNLTPFRQSNLTIGSQDCLTPSFLTTTAKNFS